MSAEQGIVKTREAATGTITKSSRETTKVNEAVIQAVNSACDAIAPTWPLDRMIAVNPYWGRRHQTFDDAAQDLATLAGSALTMPPDYYLTRWRSQAIREEHVTQAIREKGLPLTANTLVQQLEDGVPAPRPAPLFSDILDGQRDLPSSPAWCDVITHQVAQFCAAYFDQDESLWCPDQTHNLYATWRQAMTHDHSVALLMKAPEIPATAKSFSDDSLLQIQETLTQLQIDPADWEKFLHVVLLRLSGWAAWCAYQRWQAGLKGEKDNTIIDLLAVRLSWERLMDDGARHHSSTWSRWHDAWRAHFQEAEQHPRQTLLIWQRAHEISYQWSLAQKLASPKQHPTPTPQQRTSQTTDQTTSQKTAHTAHANDPVRPAVQAAFCIDVRSEVFRRHLENESDDIQTLGFAGFFGLPISYTPLGTSATRPQLPGLLAPAFNITDSSGSTAEDAKLKTKRQQTLGYLADWQPFQSVPASAFSLVETLGLGYLGKLIKRNFPRFGHTHSQNNLGLDAKAQSTLRPQLCAQTAGGYEALANIAQQVLTGMNLTTDFARLVLLIGHGSQTENNAQRAGLECGACCGQTGEVNARALANLLNDPSVRAHLKLKGITIAPTTLFLAGLHNTTTDEITLFDADEIPNTHQTDLTQIQHYLAQAGEAARQERAASLGLEKLADQPGKLFKAIQHRANDWAQTRPEWGLANNAAFIIAPRERSRGVVLAGRSFLHEYDPQNDPDGSVLEKIMTAPMIVTNWINMQYFASTVDTQRYGSGNKTLHNVVGGRLGVFEGNGGDLRVGLAWQSIHNGTEWSHEPLRLTVVIEAPRQAIERVISAHQMVRELVQNQWLYLLRIDNAPENAASNSQSPIIEAYCAHGEWQAIGR